MSWLVIGQQPLFKWGPKWREWLGLFGKWNNSIWCCWRKWSICFLSEKLPSSDPRLQSAQNGSVILVPRFVSCKENHFGSSYDLIITHITLCYHSANGGFCSFHIILVQQIFMIITCLEIIFKRKYIFITWVCFDQITVKMTPGSESTIYASDSHAWFYSIDLVKHEDFHSFDIVCVLLKHKCQWFQDTCLILLQTNCGGSRGMCNIRQWPFTISFKFILN